MHISPYRFAGDEQLDIKKYISDISPIFGNRCLKGMAIPAPTQELKSNQGHLNNLKFFSEQLDLFPDFVGEVMVKPEESYDEICSHISHPKIKGLKCYHKYANREISSDADIHEYLSESALQIANDLGLVITLHLVKERALSDPANMREIKNIVEKYPNLKLIFAHSARAFSAWTVIEIIQELVPYENIFFDFSAICESPSIIAILKKIGISRCMWGSDYNVSMNLGKAISLGNSFYWIDEDDISVFSKKTKVYPRHIIIENLMAVREASIISELSSNAIENLFYNNASQLFK